MAGVGLFVADLAGGGRLEALESGAVGFHFGHLLVCLLELYAGAHFGFFRAQGKLFFKKIGFFGKKSPACGAF
jgi:hypothetical protein